MMRESKPIIATGSARQSYSSRCLADIEPLPVNWLWPMRMALGKLNLIAGHPGRGKSTLSLHMAALVSTGGEWPDGTQCPQGNVAFITCEDDPADTLVPRLLAANADLSRCHLLDAVDDEKGGERPFNLKTDVAKIEELARDKGGLSLIIIDPISAYLNGIDSHNVAEVRSALVPLQQMAERLAAAVVIVSHFNKGTPDGSALSRVAGSGAFVAVCRSAWAVERDPEHPEGGRRILAPMKNNIGDDRTGFAFIVE
ncbi:MAG: AAA family ATPase, partial [Hyphomicrobium sp.]